MTARDPVREALAVLRGLLVLAQARPGEYVLFGSAVLYLHGIRSAESVGDVDVFVSRRVWGQMLEMEADVLTPRAGDPPLLEFADLTAGKALHAFYGWSARDPWMSVEACFDSAEDVGGWRCASLEVIRGHKAHAHLSPDRAKHERDLALIDSYRARIAEAE